MLVVFGLAFVVVAERGALRFVVEGAADTGAAVVVVGATATGAGAAT